MFKIDYMEYYDIVRPILFSEEFQRRKNFPHHGEITVYDHCLNVSKKAYVISKILMVDYYSASIGGLLHDFYTKPWQDVKEKVPFFKKHGFRHAGEAFINANYFYPAFMNIKIEDIIKRHMFPLNIIPPKYIESWIVTISDKIVSMEVFKKPKDFYKYIGISRGKKNE